MDSYPPFTEFPHILPISTVPSQPYDVYDPSLPSDHPFVTRAEQFQFRLTSPFDQPKPHDASSATQPWWKDEGPAVSLSYIAPEYPVSADRFSPWNSEISTISDPQSPRSSHGGSIPGMNCIASPHYYHDELPMTKVEEQTSYPAPNTLVDLDHTSFLSKPGVFEVQPDHRSSFETDLDPWSGSQSDRNGTPEQQWSSPLPTEVVASFPQPEKRAKARPATKSRVRKAGETKSSSTTARSGRRRAITSTNTGENGVSRMFVCSFAPYGCESTFVSKNEWKRHVTSQHLQLGFYRCDVGKCSSTNSHTNTSTNTYLTPAKSSRSCNPSPPPSQPNDFNRKDLFTQHQRRMHAPWLQAGRRRTPTDTEHAAFETGLEEVRRRCWHGLRTLPQQSHCGFCREVFSGEGSWDVRMEHVGRHFERDDRQELGHEEEDVALREWGLREGILSIVDGGRCRLASLVGE
ncbi:uncharacterized protein N7473_012440 [Penicillium subrubescens]|uniref:C2H2-type domain-containing protein n=1 Tax=Penicillium subrubescens TaxID=1316194 RepID=A0A1Q5SRF8_9EURO|nr:uncharacterized protein N7473_012440 [Penicillium subrubescens]KAJ5875093.1 hypothetical protein N7473_012440 [Penicillium subrubescens]OKO90584.1 hypothetical protein PENSUB_13301 [Penicillium subrubescens]